MRTGLLIVIYCLLSQAGLSQSILDQEITNLAKEVAAVAGEHLNGHNIAISDIIDSEGNTTELGKLLADELSYVLSGNQDKFKIVDRSQFKTLMDEIDISPILDDNTVLKLGRMVGISVVIYGKIYQQTDHYRVFLKYAILEKQVTENLCRGQLTRVPSVDRMFKSSPTRQDGSQSARENPKDSDPAPSLRFPPYQDGTLTVQFNGCSVAGSVLQCTYYVTSMGQNQTFMAYGDGTYVQQGSKRVGPTSLAMDGKQSGFQLSTVLEANRASLLIVQFGYFSGGGGASVNLHARTPATFDFNYINNNIQIN